MNAKTSFTTISLEDQNAKLPPCTVCGAPSVVRHGEVSDDKHVHCMQCLLGTTTVAQQGTAPSQEYALAEQMLRVSVPLQIAQIQGLSDDAFATLYAHAEENRAQQLHELYNKVLNEFVTSVDAAAANFRALAQMLALLAFTPAGAIFGNTHWTAQRGK